MMWRSRLLAWVAPLLLVAQVALALHQFEHRISQDAPSVAHECVLCNVASGAAPPPTPFVVLPPEVGVERALFAVITAPCCDHVSSNFLSRAPPVFVAL
jgi:hypothetical protein